MGPGVSVPITGKGTSTLKQERLDPGVGYVEDLMYNDFVQK